MEPTASELLTGKKTSTTTTIDKSDIVTDTHGSYTNYRYTGANPDNYACLTRNCTQKFRIIGVFNEDTHGKSGQQLVKLITSDSLGNMPWDYKQNGVGSSDSDYGSSDWSDAQVMYMLNGYVSSSIHTTYTLDGNDIFTASSGGYKIYILNNGNSYLTGNGATSLNQPVATTTVGYSEQTANIQTLTSAQASLIEEVTWHLGAIGNFTSSKVLDYYTAERNTETCATAGGCSSSRLTSWVGKIGLMYPSDYGYATSGESTCSNTALYGWDRQSTCYLNDWLYYTGSNATNKGTATSQWTINHYSNSSGVVYDVDSAGYVGSSSASTAYAVRPSFYLKSNVTIIDGDGSYTDPFIFDID